MQQLQFFRGGPSASAHTNESLSYPRLTTMIRSRPSVWRACAALLGVCVLSLADSAIPQVSTGSTGSAHPADYIACIFDSNELRINRGESPLVTSASENRIDPQTADRVLALTSAALQSAVVTALTQDSDSSYKQYFSDQARKEYAAAVAAKYKELLKPAQLVGLSEESATAFVQQLAGNALQLAASDYAVGRNNITNTVIEGVKTSVQSVFSKQVKETITSSTSKTPFAPPNDVICSMALLTWHETSDTFGRRVANTYIGIQVTVRNLNSTNEFLIHDVQVAIDGGPAYSRFQAGRDKLLVRNVAQRGQSEDRRNLALHALEAVGAIAGSSAISGSRDFASGIAVFQGAFIPSFSTLFPDHTIEQLNHVNDLVFSASSSSKVVVPIQGSVPLVTFISEKPLEQIPYARCGRAKKGTPNPPLIGQTDDPCLASPFVGAGTTPVPPALRYKDWDALALRLLQEHTFVVIGGVHIKELPKESANIARVTCPSLPTSAVDLSKAKDGSLTCDVNGTGLGSISSATLEKGTEAIVGKFKADDSGTTATMTFDPLALSDGQGDYRLAFKSKTGDDIASGEVLRLAPQPVITDVPKSLDGTQRSLTLSIKGKHLDKLQSVSLVPQSGAGNQTPGVLPPAVPEAATNVTITLRPTAPLATGKYELHYKIRDAPDEDVDLDKFPIDVAGPAVARPVAPVVPNPVAPAPALPQH